MSYANIVEAGGAEKIQHKTMDNKDGNAGGVRWEFDVSLRYRYMIGFTIEKNGCFIFKFSFWEMRRQDKKAAMVLIITSIEPPPLPAS